MIQQEPRSDVQALLSYMNAAHFPSIEEQTPAEARASMVAALPQVDLPMPDVPVQRKLLIPGPGGTIVGLLLDVRDIREPGPIVVWYHGGGFVTGGIETHRSFAADVVRQLDLPVVVVEYRLAPEAPYPAAVEDAEAAARWVAGNPAELGITVNSLVLAGDSGGGTLAIVAAMALRDTSAALPVIAHLVLYPATDFSRSFPSRSEFAEGYLLTESGLQWYRHHYNPEVQQVSASPLLGTLAGMPPAVVLTAGMDIVRDEGRAYAAKLVDAGVPTTFLEATGMIHAFVLLRKVLPSSQQDISAALRATLHLIESA